MKQLARTHFPRLWPGVFLVLAWPFAFAYDGAIFEWSRTLGRGVIEFFQVVTHIGEGTWILVFFAVSTILLFAARHKMRDHKFWDLIDDLTRKFAFIFISVAGAGLIAAGLKYLFGRARPTHFDELGAYYMAPLSTDAEFASFPSGHSTNIFALAFSLAVLLPWARVPLLLLASGIAFSRVAIGAHFLSDIIAGAFLSFLFVLWWRQRAQLRGFLPLPLDGRVHSDLVSETGSTR